MLFNSFEFLLFLPVVFAAYWALSARLRLQNAFVVAASYLFYGWWDVRFLALIAFTSAWSYAVGLVELPPEFCGIRKNRGLESLEISADGREMWTCNENSLGGDEAGNRSVRRHEYLRLTRFSRSGAAADGARGWEK